MGLRCVLFEMLSGQRAFGGADVSDTLAAVLRAEVNLDALPHDTPHRVRHVLGVCLQREPKQRVRDIADMRLAMEGAFESSTPADVSTGDSKRIRLIISSFIAVALVALVVGLGLAAWAWWRPHPSPVVRHRLSVPMATALPGALSQRFEIAPDGGRLLYVGSVEAGGSRLWQREMNVLNPSPIPGSERVYAMSFSPDGRQVVFLNSLRELLVVSFGGESPVKVADVDILGSLAWGPNDAIYTEGLNGLVRASASGGVQLESVSSLRTGETRQGRIPDFPVTRSHPPASWPSTANSSICRTYRKTAGEESRRRSPVANRWMRP